MKNEQKITMSEKVNDFFIKEKPLKRNTTKKILYILFTKSFTVVEKLQR